jgi:hypothetical protein
MDRGTDPNSIAVELITLVTKTSSYFFASRRWGLVSFKDLTAMMKLYHETEPILHTKKPASLFRTRQFSDHVNGGIPTIFAATDTGEEPGLENYFVLRRTETARIITPTIP